MRREITVDGKPFRVEFDNCDLKAPFSVKVNDKPVEVVLQDGPDYKKSFTLLLRGKPYTVELTKIDRQTPFTVKINNTPFRVELRSTTQKIAALPTSAASALVQRSKKIVGEGVVTAPMAGKIISVRVKKGDAVKAGDVICTLEAMKMENEVTASKGGVVEEVMVQEGKTVNADDILVVIK